MQDVAIREVLKGTVCPVIVIFTANEVYIGQGGLSTILVKCVISLTTISIVAF